MNELSRNSHEMALLLEMLRTPVDELRLRACVENVGDWQTFIELCQRHQVTPLVVRNLANNGEQAGTEILPAKVSRQLRVVATMIEQKNQRFAAELAHLHAAFESAGIEILHYKGASAAVFLYDDVGMRQFGDIDFLFAMQWTEQVLQVLGQCGYQDLRERPDQGDYLYRFEKDLVLCKGPFIIEPHWSLTARRISIDIDYAALWARSRELPFQSVTLRTFSPEDMLNVLGICGAKAQWQRLQMITDIAQIIRRYPNLDWQYCLSCAERSGSARMIRVGLFAATNWLGAQVPDFVEEWVRCDPRLPGLVSMMCGVLMLDDPEAAWAYPGPTSFNRFMFALHEGVVNKCIYLFRSTTSPSALHLRRFPLPSFLRWLYCLIVPIHDYAAVPAARKVRGWLSS